MKDTEDARPARAATAEPAKPRRASRAVPDPGPPAEPLDESERAHPSASADLTPLVGQNLRRLRTKKGLSLQRLSEKCGVSRAMLGQIELGQSTPTINVLWRISAALDVPFSGLLHAEAEAEATVLPAAKARKLMSHSGAFSSRALFPRDVPRPVEFYELRLAPGGEERADPHPPGTTENLIVTKGRLVMVLPGAKHELGEGDAILFEADRPHAYKNPGDTETVMYLVMTYAALRSTW